MTNANIFMADEGSSKLKGEEDNSDISSQQPDEAILEVIIRAYDFESGNKKKG